MSKDKSKASLIAGEVNDYLMSEKFGLDWKNYDSVRMAYFLDIFATINKRDIMEAKKAELKNKSKNHGAR